MEKSLDCNPFEANELEEVGSVEEQLRIKEKLAGELHKCLDDLEKISEGILIPREEAGQEPVPVVAPDSGVPIANRISSVNRVLEDVNNRVRDITNRIGL